MIRRWGAAAMVALGISAAGSAEGATLPLIGNATAVEVVAPLGALGLGAAPFGSATADTGGAFPVFTFPVTGGALFPDGNALVEHAGSGVTLSGGGASASVGGFLIDTAGGTVSGDLVGVADAVPLFLLGAGDARPGIELLISPELGDALGAVFGAEGLAGATFGYAQPDLAPIPLPAGAALMLAAIGALGAARLRRRTVPA